MVACTVTSESEGGGDGPCFKTLPLPLGSAPVSCCREGQCSWIFVWDRPLNRIKEQWLIPVVVVSLPGNRSAYPTPDPKVWGLISRGWTPPLAPGILGMLFTPPAPFLQTQRTNNTLILHRPALYPLHLCLSITHQAALKETKAKLGFCALANLWFLLC